MPTEKIEVQHKGQTYFIEVDNEFTVEAASAYLGVRPEVVMALAYAGYVTYARIDETGRGLFSEDDLQVIENWLNQYIDDAVAEQARRRN